MSRRVQFDIVSDVVCPWCAIGLAGLEQALDRIGGEIAADLRFHPLELNPGLPREGEPIADNVARKYGITADEARTRGGGMREAAAAVGVSMAGRSERIYDTFDAHRLLYWAAIEGQQLPLKKALLAAYFDQAANVSDPAVLIAAAGRAGLDMAAARTVLADGRYADEVRVDEDHWRSEGVLSVPTVIIDGQFVIQGAQTPERYEKAIRRSVLAA